MKHTKLVLTVLFLMTLSTQLLGSFNNFEMDDYNFGVKTINSDAADIDHDGDLDFLTIQSYFSHMHLTRNNGANGLSNAYITNYASDAKFIDFDGDGWDDIVYHYNYGTAGLYFLRNDQTGNFVQHSILSTTDLGSSLAANGVATIAVGDYDADGDEDLLIGGGRHNPHVIVLKNNGSGGFTEAYTHPLSYDHSESRFADFDGDGDLDFMMLTGKWYDYNSQPMVWENTGFGFQVAYTEPAPFMISAARDGDVADLDGDGDLDIVAAGPYSNGFSGVVIYENTGNFNFTVHQIYDQTGMTMGGVRAGDFDLDGDIDLITSTGLAWDPDGHSLTIFSNEGGLNFVQAWDGDQSDNNGFATVINNISWVGDAESDGDLEVMTGEYYAGYLHGFMVPPPAPPPTEQTFTIFGGNGNVGDIDPYTQALPAGATEWQQAYLTGGHPWGLIPGTNSWVNYDPDNTVGLNTRTPYRIRFMVPADFTDPSMVFTLKADNRAIIWINDTYIDSVDGSATPNVPDQIVAQALHPGLNEIRLTMVDWGGIVGLNYKIDVTMTSAEDISGAVLTPDDAAALNNAPVADAGTDQAINIASATLDGSGSSDPDGNLLSYSWSENGNVIATGVNPSITLVDGSHTIILTVSDGELSATDQVIVVVVTNQAPIADAGTDFNNFVPVGGSATVSLDGSTSSDPDGDGLTYSWSGSFGTASGVNPSITLSAGTHAIDLTVDDGNGGTATDQVVVTVTEVNITSGPVSRSIWEMNRGAGWSYLGFTLPSHGHISGYANASIPPTTDANWESAPNPETIRFSESSILPGNCLSSVDYTYFQTFVTVPLNTDVTQFTIEFSGIDDGGRVSIFNSTYPNGIIVPGSYVYLSESGTSDLAAYVVPGENRIVVTQMDDCPTGNNLQVAYVVLNGETINNNQPPVADAGDDQSALANGNAVSVDLDGSGSSDPDGDNLTYSWSGPFGTASGVAPTVSLSAGTHTVSLTVSDPNGLTSTDDMQFTITDVDFPVDGLVGHWPGNGNANDFSGRGHDGTEDATVSYVTGVSGQAFHFTGADMVVVPHAADLQLQSYTYSLWFKYDGGQSYEWMRLFGKGDFSNRNYNAWLHTKGNRMNNSSTNNNTDGFGPIDPPWSESVNNNPNKWYHMVGTYDGSEALLYIDGVVVASETKSITLATTSSPLTFGYSGFHKGFIGSIDEICLYGMVLTPAEINETFEMLNPNTAPVAVAGADQAIDCAVGNVDVTIDGSGSSDPDGDALTYSWELNGALVNTAVSFTTSLAAGSYTYTLTVDDGNGETATDDVVITIVADTEAPVITLLGDNPMNLGLYLAYTEAGYETVDACGSAVTVEVTGMVEINTPGPNTLTYTATDEGGNSSSVDRVVDVFNTAPTVENAIDDFQLSFGDEFLSAEFDLAAVFTDVDTNDVLSYSFSNSNGSAASVTLNGSLLIMSALDLGETVIEITATDPWGASVTHDIVVTVDVTPVLADAVVFGIRQADFKKRTQVFTGNILVNGLSVYCSYNQDDDDDSDHGGGGHGGGYGFDCGFAGNLKIDRDVDIAGGYQVQANCISLHRNTVIESDVYYNFLDNNNATIYGDEFSPIDIPLFTTLPPFKSAPAGTDNITVNKNQTMTLAPGDYGKITVKDRGQLTLSGGVYNVKSIKLDKRAELHFADAAEVRVVEKVEAKKQTYIGPSDGAFIDASNIIFYVNGQHGNHDDDDDDYSGYCNEPGHGHHHGSGHHSGHPRNVVKFDKQSMVFANFYAPEHKIELKKDVEFTGALYAWEVKVDDNSELTLDSYFNIYNSGLAKQVAWSKPAFEWLPEQYVLEQNYPNPFNPSTTISYAIPNDGMVSLRIYNLLGQEVANLVNEFQESGYHQVVFEAGHLSSGVYLAVMQSAEFVDTRKIILIK